MVVVPGEVRFLDENDQVVYSSPINRNEEVRDESPSDPGDLTAPERLGFSDAKLTGKDRRFQQYEGNGYLLEINETRGIARVTYFDEEGSVAEESTILFDFNNPDRNLPEFEMSLSPDELPSGSCVFKVKMTWYSEYTDYTNEGEINPRRDDTVAEHESIKVWPNPASNTLYLNIDAQPDVITSVMLMGLDGKLVLHDRLPGQGVHQIDIQAIPAGTYILRTESDNLSKTSKIVIQ